jgi:MOSC domain-containing protein YiiM
MMPVFEGRVVAIYVAPAEGAPMEARDEAQALAGKGLDGDRYAIEAGKFSGTKVGKRAVTLIEREAIAAANATYDLGMAEEETRRNLVVEGVPLNHLVGREFVVGDVRLRGYDFSEPCAYLEELTGKPARKALLHRGGLRAEIVDGGPIRVGDVVRPDPSS